MKRIGIFVLALGAFFLLGMGIHAGLITVASGSGTWADRAAATCAACHGG